MKRQKPPTPASLRATARRAISALQDQIHRRSRSTTDIEEKTYLWVYLEKLRQAKMLLEKPRRTSAPH